MSRGSGLLTIRILLSRLLAMFAGRRRDHDLNDEIEAHLEHLAADFRAKGLSAADARLAARREFGGVTAIQETCRERRRLPVLDPLIQDVRYALRTMLRAPGFTAVAVLTLALGIGANTAIFQVLYALVLKPLPVRDPHQLVELQAYHDGHLQGFSYPLAREVIERQNVLDGVITSAHAQLLDVLLDGRRLTKRPQGLFANGSYFRALGTEPQLGRFFAETDDRASAPAVAVISDRFWRREFAGGMNVIGKSILVRNVHIAVIGVARQEFFGETVGESPDLWIPLSLVSRLQPGMPLEPANVFLWRPMGRLRGDVPLPRAQAELDALYKQLKPFTIRSKEAKQYRLVLAPAAQGKGALHQEFGRPLWILMAIVGVLMLIACCNLANLLLARATARTHEIGVRLAVGATRARLVRQLLAESTLLAVAGGGLAFLLGDATAQGLVKLATVGQELTLSVDPDWRVAGFVALVSFGALLMFGTVPALAATRTGIGSTLQAGQRTHSAGAARHVASNGFVVAQVALCLMLLAGASLLTRSFWKITHQDFGYQPDRVLTAYLHFDDEDGRLFKVLHSEAFRDALYRKVRAIPGIRRASLSIGGPLFFVSDTRPFAVPGRDTRDNDQVSVVRVYPQYFETMGIPMMRGRPITEDDRRGAPRVAVISETTARRFFADENPIGRSFAFRQFDAARSIEIVGVARDIRYEEPREDFRGLVFVPLEQTNAFSIPEIVVTADGDLNRFAEPLRKAITELVPGVDLWGVKTLGETVLTRLRRERLLAWLSASFGALALVLACVGLYGVVGYRVRLRRQEIGIRLALGASPRRLRVMLVGEVLRMIAIGVAIGAGATLAATRLLQSILFELSPRDPVTLVAAAGVLTVVAVAAALLAARSASAMNPITALRTE